MDRDCLSCFSDGPTEVVLFTDGACHGNPGPGGWAFILRHRRTGRQIEQSGAEPQTTNNRMELLAVIRGLEALKRPTSVELVTDSQYVARGLAEWLPRWKARGWRRTSSGQVKNLDLWQRLDELLGRHRLQVRHIPSHTGHPENERCDQLAVAAYKQFLPPPEKRTFQKEPPFSS
ncbi:MAG: ribonuclease HI [Thermoguttaceae bacterium]|nr:ribonuclease HI [Thermoguttaceae bacterium]MDW8039776.1 ribonuclease HI [Thermoguttaceae bacterium]